MASIAFGVRTCAVLAGAACLSALSNLAAASELPLNGRICVAGRLDYSENPEGITGENLATIGVNTVQKALRGKGLRPVERADGDGRRVFREPSGACEASSGDFIVHIEALRDDGRGDDFVRLTVEGTADRYEAKIPRLRDLPPGRPTTRFVIVPMCIDSPDGCPGMDVTIRLFMALDEVLVDFTDNLTFAGDNAQR